MYVLTAPVPASIQGSRRSTIRLILTAEHFEHSQAFNCYLVNLLFKLKTSQYTNGHQNSY